MTAKEAEKLVKQNGWYFDRQNGSHRIYKHNQIPGIVIIPFHGKRDLTKGTLHSILKKAQIR